MRCPELADRNVLAECVLFLNILSVRFLEFPSIAAHRTSQEVLQVQLDRRT